MTGCSNWRQIMTATIWMVCAAVPAAALDGVTFDLRGADSELARTVQSASQLAPLARGSDQPVQDILGLAKADYALILAQMYRIGRYGAVISIQADGREVADISPLSPPNAISNITVTVNAGPAFVFDKAAIAPLPNAQAAPADFAAGKLAGSGVIVGATAGAITAWRDIGHAKAAVSQNNIAANHASQTVTADISIDPGPRLTFGDLAVEGARNVRSARVQAIAGLPSGEVFSPADLDRVANRLRRTGAFSSVVLEEAGQIGTGNTLGVTAVLAEERPRRLAVAANLASLEGLSLGISGTHRNLLGGAERVILAADATRIGVQTGGLDYTLSAKFERPATFTPDTTFSLGVEFDRLREVQTTSDTLNLTTSLTHYFSDTLTGTGGLAYSISRASDPSGARVFRTLAFPFTLAWDTRNFKKSASDGVFMTADIKPFAGFGAADSGVRFAFDARGYKGVAPSDRLVLAARVQVGAIFGASLAGTPRDDLFYSGGPATVRGQPYRSLSVSQLQDSSGTAFETGGTHYLGGSIEARGRISDNLGLVGFLDVGRIDAGGFFNTANNWHAGAGLGLRYLTAIGPVRLDVAGPVGGNTGNGAQIYVGIGQAF
jgi:translocation and assembly module TamA